MKAKACIKILSLGFVLMTVLFSCSGKKYHTNSLKQSSKSNATSENNYHLKTANKIVDENSKHEKARERRAERKRKRYNRRQEKKAEEKTKNNKSRYKDKKSSGKVPLY